MPLLAMYHKFVDAFFTAIAPLEGVYQDTGFSYIAVRSGADFVILRGRVFMNTTPPDAQPEQFISANVRAGHYKLSDLKLDVRGVLAKLIEGQIATPDGPLCFRTAPGGQCAASFTPFHPEGLQSQRRINVLTLMGGPVEPVPQPDIDWEIKAGSPPYDSLHELSQVFGLGALTGPTITVEFVAYNAAVIDGDNSKVSGENAHVRIRAAKGLLPDHLTLGYRIYLPGAITRRETISGTTMQWTHEAKFDSGHIDIGIPKAAALNCTVSYHGNAQSHLWISDPEQVQNARRAAYETFDPKLENLKSIMANAQTRGQDAREFEMAVAWLLWMLGFSVIHLGAGRRSREAPDQVLAAPSGNLAVVECTTGLLKAENKLALLHDRTEAVRRKLAASNNAHLRVLPIIVTSKTATEIKPDVEVAERLGVLILTREGLDQAIDRTLMQLNADQLYTEAEQSVSAALAKYEVQPTQPTNDNLLSGT
jgi:hypothetical protein